MYFITSLLFAGSILISATANAISEAPLTATSQPSAPPRKCEIRQSAWCIYQDAWQITRRFDDKTRNVVWILSGLPRPDSQLVLFEPYGCRKGFADMVAALGFGENIEWDHRAWDEMRIRFKADGSCDLRFLVPLFNHDPMEWAFSTGRGLIAACRDEVCTPIAPTLSDVTDKYQKQFRRE